MLKSVDGQSVSSPFDKFDIKKRNFITSVSVAQGTPNVSKLYYPHGGFDALFEQIAGPIGSSGTLQGTLEESDDDTNWTTVKERDSAPGVAGPAVSLAVAAAANDVQQVRVRITKKIVRYTATVSVTSGTVITSASLIS